MTRFRFSLSTMFGAVVLIAVGLAAMIHATPLWAGVSTSAVVFVLLVAIFGITYRQGQRRAFWLGFAVFGWTYLFVAYGFFLNADLTRGLGMPTVLSFVHQVTRRYGPPAVDSKGAVVVWQRADGSVLIDERRVERDELIPELQQQLQQTRSGEVLFLKDPEVGRRSPISQALNKAQRDGIMRYRAIESTVPVPAEEDFTQVGTAFFSLMMGLIGGLIARGFYATRDPTP